MPYDREVKYAHPFIAMQLDSILQSIKDKLPQDYKCKLISAYRKSEDQLNLYKIGREFRNGAWRITDRNKVVTYKDGYVNKSRHNYLPCTAIDIGIFDTNNKYVTEARLYNHVKEGKNFGLEWGGDWTNFKDSPHLEIPSSKFFQRNMEKDNGLIWQNYLIKSGAYKGVEDGIFGPKSIAALKDVTGETERNIMAWDQLYQSYGSSETTSVSRSTNYFSVMNDRSRPNPVTRPRPNPGQRPRPKGTGQGHSL